MRNVLHTGPIDAVTLTDTTFFQSTSFEEHGVVTFFCGVFTVSTATGTATFNPCGTLNGENGRYEETFILFPQTFFSRV